MPLAAALRHTKLYRPFTKPVLRPFASHMAVPWSRGLSVLELTVPISCRDTLVGLMPHQIHSQDHGFSTTNPGELCKLFACATGANPRRLLFRCFSNQLGCHSTRSLPHILYILHILHIQEPKTFPDLPSPSSSFPGLPPWTGRPLRRWWTKTMFNSSKSRRRWSDGFRSPAMGSGNHCRSYRCCFPLGYMSWFTRFGASAAIEACVVVLLCWFLEHLFQFLLGLLSRRVIPQCGYC